MTTNINIENNLLEASQLASESMITCEYACDPMVVSLYDEVAFMVATLDQVIFHLGLIGDDGIIDLEKAMAKADEAIGYCEDILNKVGYSYETERNQLGNVVYQIQDLIEESMNALNPLRKVKTEIRVIRWQNLKGVF